MQASDNSSVGQKGRFYLTKHIWVPQEPIENLNLKMSDMILRRMPKLPLGGEDAIKAFPVLVELKKPRPNPAVIERLMKRFMYSAGVLGAMQIATLIIMTKLASS